MRLAPLTLALLTTTALADAVDVSLKNPTAVRGKSYPTVEVNIREPISGFQLTLKRDDGKQLNVKGGGKPGQTRSIELEQPEGRSHWTGELTVNLPDGTTSAMPVEFDSSVYGPLQLKLDKEKDVDLANRRIVLRLNHPAAKVALRVLMDTGQYAFDGDVAFHGEAPDSPLELTWPAAPGTPMRIDLQAFDPWGFFTGLKLSPWRVDIPHEEVNFDTGKWDVRAAEQAKLDKSYGLISEAVEKYGRLAELNLYVAGHTDSVGSNASNLTLSHRRARAIADYFRKKGLRIPISCEGFGEEALLVATPDDTDEPRNRRAEYIISIDPPSAKNTSYRPKWERL